MNTKILFAALLLITFLNYIAAAQTKTNVPRTVTDFYLQLPAGFVDGTEGVGERRKRVAVEDAANGYLKLKPTKDQNEGEYTEIAIFKKSGGGYIIGIVNVGCTENCGGVVQFLERRADRWTDVTNQVFPVTRETELLQYRLKKTAAHRDYETTQVFWTQTDLPRAGRTIRVKYTGEGKDKEFELFSISWNGERFAAGAPLPQGATAPVSLSDKVLADAETAWKPFFERVKIAVQKRDRLTLKNLMPKDFHYNCCDEGDDSGDNRQLAFRVWDGDSPKDYAGWKSLERVLRTETMVETTSGEDRPMRSFDDAIFEFGADGRWVFTSYGASDML